MAELLYKLGKGSAKRAWLVIISWIVILAIGIGAFAAFSGKLVSTVSIPGTETERVTDSLSESIPEAAGGSGSFVIQTADGAEFTQQQKEEIAALLEKVEKHEIVESAVNPFDSQAELDKQRKELADGQQELATAKQKLQTAPQELADGEKELAEGEKQLADGQQQLQQGEAESAAGERELLAARAQLAEAQAQLEAGEAELAAQKQQYAVGKQQLDAAVAAMQAAGIDPATNPEIVAQQQQLAAAAEQLAGAEAQLAQGRAEYEAGAAQLSTGWYEYDQGLARLAQARSELENGEAELAEGKKELEQGRADLAKAQQEIPEAEKKLELSAKLLEFSKNIKLVSDDDSTAVVNLSFTDSLLSIEETKVDAVLTTIKDNLPEGVNAYFSHELVQGVGEILGAGEIVGLIIALIVLLVLMRAVVPATVPLLTAVIGVGVGVTIALAFSGVIEMMSVTPVLGVMLGLAVGIDYSLFIINRHRTQLKHGTEILESIGLANGTSGNAVVFAGVTVIIALLGLNVSGIPFLGLMGTVAAFCVFVAVCLSITFTPALMGLAGLRVLSRKERKALAQANTAEIALREANAKSAIKPMSSVRAVLTVVAATVALAVIALPAMNMRLGMPTALSEPVDSSEHQAYKIIDEEFGEGANSPLLVVAEPNTVPDGEDELLETQAQIAQAIYDTKNVTAVAPIATSDDNSVLAFQVLPQEGPNAESTQQLVHDLRALSGSSQTDAEIGVAGNASAAIDVSERLADALPVYLAVVVGLSLIILIMVFRSILVPLIATGGYVLSLLATFGALTAIYQYGWLAEIFAVTEPAPILAFLPIIAMGILFGLAMDYQLFIASGMREAYAHGSEAKVAVQQGLKAGRSVVIAAALIMISVFAGFIFSHMTMIKPIGFALAFGVLVDAFIVRLLLMPALMHLFGKAAWWAPKWLLKIMPNLDVEGEALVKKHDADVKSAQDYTAAAVETGATEEQDQKIRN